MLRNARSVGATVAMLAPLAAVATGELAQQYDDRHKVAYAKRQLLDWRRGSETAANSDSKPDESAASAWLGTAPPKFPYLLSISKGDDPSIVAKALLGGARVLGSYEEPTRDMLERFTTPTLALELLIHKIARRYSELKTTLHGDVPADFDPRVGLVASAEAKMMDAVLFALQELASDGEDQGELTDEEGSPPGDLQQEPVEASAVPVFFLRDFDGLNDQNTERWLRWTYQVTNNGLAHVVLLTTSTVTPTKVEWLQARHQRGLNANGSDMEQDFVAILLRSANGLVDASSAEEKLRKLSDEYNLKLFSEEQRESMGDDAQDNGYDAPLNQVVEMAGNWWSDLDLICRRLKDRNLSKITSPEERSAIIQEVCDSFLQDAEVSLLEALSLDGSLQLQGEVLTGVDALPLRKQQQSNESQVLSALETWKCLETLADVTPAMGGNALIGSPQQLLDQKKDKKPLNCASPVDALLPFNYREEGEQKFLDLIDCEVLFLRPKDAVEIGVIPCQKAALVTPCWVQTRPVIKNAFERIHRNDGYFSVILELERFAAGVEMRKEVDLYEQEIADRRQFYLKSKSEFSILQFTMTPAEKAQRNAELALIEVELQAKDVYLEKLRSLMLSS